MLFMTLFDMLKYFIFNDYNKNTTRSYGHPDFDALRLVKNMTFLASVITVVILYRIDINLVRDARAISISDECPVREINASMLDGIKIKPLGAK